MNQKRKYKTYSKEFKEKAVSLVTDQGYSVVEAAEAVGVNPNQIYNWKKQQEEQANGTMLNDNERTELLKLRTENKRLKMEKDILKKASVDSSEQSNSCIKILICMGILDETTKTYFYYRRKRSCI